MFFFFKQKTAYEMRISDWSSDVCSSDLLSAAQHGPHPPISRSTPRDSLPDERCSRHRQSRRFQGSSLPQHGRLDSLRARRKPARRRHVACRSEEHTSELQSLMRISYAVFCLKKKKKNLHIIR